MDWIQKLAEGTKAVILAPLIRGGKGGHAESIEQIRKAGLLRARIDGQLIEIDRLGNLDPHRTHTIEAVTDRIVVRPGSSQRISESVELAIKLTGGTCIVHYQSHDPAEPTDTTPTWIDHPFSTRFSCPECEVSYLELEPKCFSFNSPYGACPGCDGLGGVEQFDWELVLPERHLAMNEETAIALWRSLPAAGRQKKLAALAPLFGRYPEIANTPLVDLSQQLFRVLIEGDGKALPGLRLRLEQEYVTCTQEKRRHELESYRTFDDCPQCQGSRLGSMASAATLDGKTIIDLNRAPLDNLLNFFESHSFPADRKEIGEPVVLEIKSRLRFLCDIGLGYLTLDREADSLSGGEFQRVRLATAIGSGLANVCYVLDEPTVGLHPSDNQGLISALQKLKQTGCTLIVVEHDADMMQNADWIIDVGPQSGVNGGHVIAEGTFEQLCKNPHSLTGRYLSGQQVPSMRCRSRELSDGHQVTIHGAQENNLQNIDVAFPLGGLVCVTGVSGSGKSSLVLDTLGPAMTRRLGKNAPRPGRHTRLDVRGPLEHLITIDQQPIGRSSRSCTATYSGLMDPLRKLFASTKQAKARGYRASRFTFNAKEGRCPECEGQGTLRIEMKFLPDLLKTCHRCQGKRFNEATLQIRYRDYSIADVLEMPMNQSQQVFENIDTIARPLTGLCDIGLGYLSLGQASTTLSGGEAQRVKLASALATRTAGQALYLVDEPTTGLHFADVDRLIDVLQQLVDQGNSVIVVEHNERLIAAADHLIELGPGAGENGGQLISSRPNPQGHSESS